MAGTSWETLPMSVETGMDGRLGEDAAQRLGVARYSASPARGRGACRCRPTSSDDLQAGARRQGTRLEAVAHQAQDLLHACPRGGADHVVGGHVGRDDVGGLAAPGDDAVDAVAGLELLAQQADGRLGHDHRVGGVDAHPGEAGGVRLATHGR